MVVSLSIFFSLFSLFSPPAGKLSTGQVEAAIAKDDPILQSLQARLEMGGEKYRIGGRMTMKLLLSFVWSILRNVNVTVSVASEHLQSFLFFSFSLLLFIYFYFSFTLSNKKQGKMKSWNLNNRNC